VFLKPGDLARPVLKARGLRPGEKIQTLRAPIRIVEVRREPLRAMLDDPGYGYDKVRREGSKGDARHGKRDAWVSFPGMHWAAWVKTGAKKPAGLVVNRLDGFLGQCLALRVVFFLAA
jgi:hypothetical protein